MPYIYGRRKPKGGKVLPPEFEGKVVLSKGEWVKPKQKQKKVTYSQNWPLYNLYQVKERLIFYKILNDAVGSMNIQEKFGARGNQHHLMSDMLKACVVKIFSGFSARRTISELELIKKMGYLREVPHYNSMIDYFNSREMEIYLAQLYKLLSIPLKGIENKFAVDSTGFSTSIKDNWVTTKFGQNGIQKINYRKWKKLHVVTGVVSNIITSATITKGSANDSPEFQGLVSETGRNFQISELSADPAYLSKKNVSLVASLGGIPYIMPRSNTSFKNRGNREWMKMVRMWRDNKDEFKRHYHLRSNIESTFSMLKRKFSDKLRSKNEQAQRNEILCKIVAHNISVLVSGIFELDLKLDWN